jgi:Predicted ATPases
MLTSLRIQNFKAWKDTGTIRLAPLTVIFGANSAGKSSLGHLLQAKGVTVEFVCPDDARRFYTKKFPKRPVPVLPSV